MEKQRHRLYRSGVFFCYVFLGATIVSLTMQIITKHRDGESVWTASISPMTIPLYIIGTIRHLTTVYGRFSLFQPLVFLGIFFVNSYNSRPGDKYWADTYTTGFFVYAVIMLYRGGYLEKRRIFKVIALGVF